MRYEEYERKIIKIAKVKKWLYRFRLPLLIGAGIVCSGVLTLLFTKGVVKDVEKIKSEYVYGEQIEFKASAFMSDVSCEFTKYGVEEWSNEIPKAVGKYSFRSKGANIFGGYYYGGIQNFEIKKLPINVSILDEKYKYGTTPNIAENFALPYGDKLSNEFNFDFSFVEKDYVKIIPDLSSLKIMSNLGEEKTNSYEINFGSSILEIDKIPVEISLGNRIEEYDEKDHFSAEYSVKRGDFLKGDKIEIVKQPLIDAGQYLLNPEYKILNGNNVEVTNFYDVKFVDSTLTINKKPITLTSSDQTVTYDGLEHKISEEQISIKDGSLCDKHTLAYTFSDTKRIKANEYENSFEAHVLDENRNDVTKNYDISYEFGKLTIEKRNLVIESGSLETVYTRKAQGNNQVSIVDGSLADKDRLVANISNYIDAGTHENTFSVKIIDSQTNEDFTDSYDIDYQYGEVIINKKPITISFESKNKVYDALNLFDNQVLLEDEYSVTDGELIEGDYIVATAKSNPSSAGVHVIEKEVNIFYENNGEKVNDTKNYDISIVDTSYIIDKAVVGITSLDEDRQYDGTNKATGDTYIITFDEQFKDYTFKNIEATTDATVPGTYKYNFNFDNFKVLNENGVDVTENFVINLTNNGKYTITKREVELQMQGGSKIYDGTPLTVSDYTCENLLLTDHLEFEGLPSVTHVSEGSIANYPTAIHVVNAEGENLDDCYYFTSVDADYIYIIPRPITLTSSSHEKVFDNKPFDDGTVTLTSGSMVGDEHFEVTYMNSEHTIHAGEDCNDFYVNIYNYNNEIDSSDYDVSAIYGDIVIIPYKVNLVIYQTHIEYDGKPHSSVYTSYAVTNTSDEIYYTNETMLEGFTFKVSVSSSGIEAGSESLLDYFDYLVYFNSNYYVYEGDFDMVYDPSFLTIDPRTIIIQSVGGSKTYDGTPFPNDVWISYGSLADGHYIEYEDVTKLLYPVEDAENPIGKPTIYDENGVDVTSNYNIILIPGRVTIYEA